MLAWCAVRHPLFVRRLFLLYYRETLVKTLFVRLGLLVALVITFGSTYASTPRTTSTPDQSTPLPLMWHQPRFNNITGADGIRSIVFDPATPGLALASQEKSGGVFLRSIDSGRSWDALPFMPSDTRFSYAIAYSSTETFLVYGAASIYKTTNGGDTWTSLGGPALCNALRGRMSIQPKTAPGLTL